MCLLNEGRRVWRPRRGGARRSGRVAVDDRNQKIDIMPPPEPSMLSYSKAILDLWGEKDEEATRVWMGERQQKRAEGTDSVVDATGCI